MARMVKSANSNGSGGKKYPDPNRKADYRPGGMYSSGRAIPPGPGTKNTRVTTPKPSKPSGINRNTKVTSAKPSKPTKRIPTSMASAMPKLGRVSSKPKPKPQSMAAKYRG